MMMMKINLISFWGFHGKFKHKQIQFNTYKIVDF